MAGHWWIPFTKGHWCVKRFHALKKGQWCGKRCHVMAQSWSSLDDVIKWKNFPRYWLFVRGESTGHREDSPHEGQWREALVFSLICAWPNGWANNRNAGDLRRDRANYDVTVILSVQMAFSFYAILFKMIKTFTTLTYSLYMYASLFIGVPCKMLPFWESLYDVFQTWLCQRKTNCVFIPDLSKSLSPNHWK